MLNQERKRITLNNSTTEGTSPLTLVLSKANPLNSLKCWNGPERSVNVDLSCGTANEITHISEPEKCEYRFQVTSPALCWPVEGEEKVERGKEGKVEL